MENIFIHDAIPTWSGFIYQGEIAIYLALKKICELRDADGLEINEIGSNYQVEVENCEDIAIVHTDENGKRYLSIHQVKNQKDTSIGAYRNPLVQLMLEKGFHTKEQLGNPDAYLHVSNKIYERSENEINQSLEEWKESVQNFYNNLKTFIERIDVYDKETTILQEIKKIVHEEPIKFNRSEYNKEMIKKIEEICNKENSDITELKKVLQKLIGFLEQKLAVNFIDKGVQVYQYEDGKKFCNGTDAFVKIVNKVKQYKQHDNTITPEQYEYIADKLIHHMREYVIERHQKKQSGNTFEKSIKFREIINILNDKLSNDEKKANILALRRLYDEYLLQYCALECENTCLVPSNEVKECKLKQNEYRRINLCDEDFIKLCYSFRPDCYNTIFDRICINRLLNEDGLNESVFKVLKKVPERFFIGKNDKTRFVIDNQSNNAFLTAISSENSNKVVQNIVKGIENNAELISPIFDADQLITTSLESDESVWCNDYSEIQEKYRNSKTEISEETNQNSICIPKKPRFIKAKEIISDFSNH